MTEKAKAVLCNLLELIRCFAVHDVRPRMQGNSREREARVQSAEVPRVIAVETDNLVPRAGCRVWNGVAQIPQRQIRREPYRTLRQ